MKIIRHAVKSSQIASVGFDESTQTLDIEFKPFRAKEGAKNTVYRYQNVTAADRDALVNAESIGSHFGKTIKKEPAKYPFRKLTPEEAAQ